MSFPRSLAFLLLFVSLASHAFAGRIWYVKPGGPVTGLGTSWTQPATLDSALLNSTGGDELRIAEGTYNPTVISVPGSTDPRDRSFLVNKSLTIIGGWLGHETGNTPPQGCAANTVLDGDQGTAGSSCDDSFHVVSITGAPGMKVVVSRVKVTGGFAGSLGSTCPIPPADTVDSRNKGGGIYIKSRSTVALSNIILDGNGSNGLGGGLFASGCNLSIAQAVVLRNITQNTPDGGGSGMYLACPTAKLVNVVFLGNGNNTARGGGLYASAGDLELSNCVFDNNKAHSGGLGTGGAIYLEGEVYARLFHCTISRNQCDAAGAESIDMTTLVGECYLFNTIVFSVTPGSPHFLAAGASFKSMSCYLQIFPGQAAPGDSSAPGYPTYYNPAPVPPPPPALDFELGGLSLAATTGFQVTTLADPALVPADALDMDLDGDTVELLPVDREKEPRFAAGGTLSMGAYWRPYPSLDYHVNLMCNP